MASDEFLQTLERSRQLLDWDSASIPAQEWWEELEALNEGRSDLVVKLTEQLLARNATIDDFFLSCSYSGREGVQENLLFLDLIYQDKDLQEAEEQDEPRPTALGSPTLH